LKLLIADDHPIVRAGLRRLLSGAMTLDVLEAATGREALAMYRRERPDIVVLDLNLPGGIDGLALLRRFILEDRSGVAPARVLVFSMQTDPIYATRALQAGARGYVSKNASPAEIVAAIERIVAGGRYVEHEIASELVLQAGSSERHPLRQLTSRHLDILRLLGEGRSLTQIAAALGISYKTTANTCTQLKERLAVARTSDLVRIAIEMRLQVQQESALRDAGAAAPPEPASDR
jgi:two-component system invasion response regulator UvrY